MPRKAKVTKAAVEPEPFDEVKFAERNEAIKKRFPNARFSISCFKTIDEIETKKLTDADTIIYADYYTVQSVNPKTDKWEHTEPPKDDNFIIHKREGSDGIYYKDVIDYLSSIEFSRDDCNHRYLETIDCVNAHHRNAHNVMRYASFWGS